MAWAPLAGGRVLTGKDKKAIAVRNALSEVGKKYNANVEQTAVAWLYKLGALPIIGSPDKKRIKNAASAYEIKLTTEAGTKYLIQQNNMQSFRTELELINHSTKVFVKKDIIDLDKRSVLSEKEKFLKKNSEAFVWLVVFMANASRVCR